MTIRKLTVSVILGFTITLAATIGMRMSTEAMTIVIGVVFGVAAGLPASILLAAAARRERQRTPPPPRAETMLAPQYQHPTQQYQQRYMPPVIVVNPGGGQVQPMGNATYPWPSMTAAPNMPQRQLQIIGGEPEMGEEW